ncbi:MAG: 3-phosphoshikimate 1-carboxyvinyltransferase [Candidatus Ancillula sp.]|jgi:3-phosphoshikimate 1-carboxyvinyltransferase|nr:3-phosphoshikimate 1-carboxyvinyltransferase [Candidatus Ancillula sp.]
MSSSSNVVVQNIYNAPHLGHAFSAVVKVPSSKSLTNRLLILQALSTTPPVLKNVLDSRDADLMKAAIKKVLSTDKNVEIDVGLAGTVMRFVPPFASIFQKRIRFTGDVEALKRPMGPIIAALEDLGVQVLRENSDFLPFTTVSSGKIAGGKILIDASKSSQFLSALLLVGAKFEDGLIIQHTGTDEIPSRKHIEMTVELLRNCGVEVEEDLQKNTWKVYPGEIQLHNTVVEPDLSNAAPFLAACLANPDGGEVSIPNWPKSTTQPGALFPEILERLGAKVTLVEEKGVQNMLVQSTGEIRSVDVNLRSMAELTPTLAALLALADEPSIIRGIGHLRGHETDRLYALVTEINKIGRTARIGADNDSIEIAQMPQNGLHSAVIESYKDHRMATFGTILGLRIPDIRVVDIATTAKTMPGFQALWEKMLGL